MRCGDCAACVARYEQQILTLAGWEVPSCDAAGHFVVTRTPRGQAAIGDRSYLELLEGGEVLDIDVVEEDLEVEAPALPYARLRVTYRQRLSEVGARLRTDLHCGRSGAPEICAKLNDRQTLESWNRTSVHFPADSVYWK